MAKLTFLLLFLISLSALAAETCSRVATINYQEVLVDVSSKNLGEGLRYYLQKDAVAKDLLDEYQKNNTTTWKSAAMSTLGTGMILGGLLRSSSGDSEVLTSRNFLLLGGVTLIAAGYIISKADQVNNEYLLVKSVDEYNKRNTPKIYLAPVGDVKSGFGVGAGLNQEF